MNKKGVGRTKDGLTDGAELQLYIPNSSPSVSWTGTGTYDVFFIANGNTGTGYVKRNVTISEVITRIPYSSFTQESL